MIQVLVTLFSLHALAMAGVVEDALMDNGKLLSLFKTFSKTTSTVSASNGLQVQSKNRLRIFRRNLQRISSINRSQSGYKLEINFFTDLSDAEFVKYYGFNASAAVEAQDHFAASPLQGEEQSSVDWVKKGLVTAVYNQGMCGSCWTYAGVGPLETRYAVISGTLKKFSEQESLDCVYQSSGKNGCRGGQFFHQWDWIKETNHQALARDYKYTGRVSSCKKTWWENGLTHAKVTGYTRVGASYDQLALALNTGPLAVGIKVSKQLNFYKTGIFKDENCGTPANHALVAVGYTNEYFKLKNSWGAHWGDSGFVKFSRAVVNMCDISLWAAFPTLERTKDGADWSGYKCEDTRSSCAEEDCGRGEGWKMMATGCAMTCGVCGCRDAMTDCRRWATEGYCTKPNYSEYMSYYCPLSCRSCHVHPIIDGGDKECKDKESRCPSLGKQGYCERFPAFMRDRCDKTCGGCEECPAGTVKCDGECKHQHMCKH